MSKPMITIPLDEFHQLLRRELWLSYLEAAGVDNWEGYDTAIDIAREDGYYDEDEE